ncbi:hypothetical protein SteCoe_17485 [Stentor coeruleus]|uniref:Uncharacterized protein n=1 Tax=Stentor coeruleus TaxID=5963 RepID=A0A1R2BZ62_9CILI|nr:hypothetical protein SteCoe_17485 [Stentor coeruleus]
MGCKITKLPEEIEITLEDQKSTLETMLNSLRPLEDDIKAAIQKKRENNIKLQEILAWKAKSEKKIAKLEGILKEMKKEVGSNSDDDILININSVQLQIEDQYEELQKIIKELKNLS